MKSGHLSENVKSQRMHSSNLFFLITNNRIRLELGEEEKIPEGGSGQKKESISTDEKLL